MIRAFVFNTIGRGGLAAGLLIAMVGCESARSSGNQPASASSSPAALTAALPAGHDVNGQTSFRCRALLESELTGSTDSLRPRGLEGKLGPGANDLSISIVDPGTLSFLSQAGFAAGTTRGTEFTIQSNTRRELVAMYFDGQSSNSFVLNKSNGFAIWSKIRPDFIGYGAPTGSSTFLSCE